MKYLVIAMRNPGFQETVIESHCTFLENLRQQNILELAGPFTDKSGGAYMIKANNLEEAQEIAHQDPLYLTQSSRITVHEWNA